MTQKELIAIISKQTHLRRDAVAKVLRAMKPALCIAFEQEETLKLSIGVFEAIIRKPKAVYDFNNKKKYTLPPTTHIRFKPTIKLIETLRERDILKIQNTIESSKKKTHA